MHNAPAAAFVDGQMIRGIKEHLFAVLRDVVFISNEIIDSGRFDLTNSASITNAGTLAAGYTNHDFSQLNQFTTTPFIMKIGSATANVRFKVYNPGNPGATLTNPAGSCSGFSWTQIGP